MRHREKLIEEDLEITTATAGAAPVQLPEKVVSIFPAFAHRNFQLYIAGQIISLLGFWIHHVALGYYVFQITNSAFWVGAAIASIGIPILLFSTLAGVYADKVNKQKLLIWTQIIDAILAVILGLVIFSGSASLPIILSIAFLGGTVAAFDLPTRLTFVVELVGKRDLASAVPINNGVFNAARFAGPALAGFLIATFGVGWAFIFNGLSYLPAIIALLNIKPIYNYKPDLNTHALESLKEGLKYSFSHPKIFYYLILAALIAITIWPYQTLMPVIAERVFSIGPQGLGTLLSAAGAGSLTGAIYTSSQARKENRIILVPIGLLISSVALLLFSLNNNLVIAHILLFFVGFGAITMISTINTLVQLASPDQMRARIMGVFLTMFVGVMPFGSFIAGIIAEKTSSLFTIGLYSSIALIFGIFLYLKGVFTELG